MINTANYFWKERSVLRFFGISLTGDESIYYKIYSFIFLRILCTPYPFLAASDLFHHDISESIDSAIYVISTTMGVAQITVLLKNRRRIGKLFEKLHREPFISNEERGGSGVEQKLLKDCVSYLSKQTNIYYVMVMLMVGPGGVYTLTKRIRSSNFNDWEFPFGPFTLLNVTYSPNYEICWTYQYVSVTTIAFNSITTALITPGILAHVSVQLKILQNFLRRIVRYTCEKNITTSTSCITTNTEAEPSTVPWKHLKKSLKEAVLFHFDITDLLTETIDIFSMLMLIMYTAMLFVTCLCLYEVSVQEKFDVKHLRIAATAVVALMHIFLISYWGEQVTTESEAVAFAAYEANVAGLDMRIQKDLSFVIRRSRKVMLIKTGGFIDLSMISFAGIVRAAYSALMVLKKSNNKDTE